MRRVSPGTVALVVVGLAASVAACDNPLRLGSARAADAGSEVVPGTTLFAADAGADAPVDTLRDPDSSVDRAGWIGDSIEGVTVSTLAGGRAPGRTDGLGEAAQFNNPTGVLLEPSGSLLVADFDNGILRRVTEAGEVTTLVPEGVLERPFGLVASAGAVYVETDVDPYGEHRDTTGTIWRVDPATGEARVIAADIGRPRGLAVLSNGRLLLSDYVLHTIRELDPGNGELARVAGLEGSAAFADGAGVAARFNEAYGVARLPDGDVLVADRLNHRIRRVTADGETTTFAGDGTRGMIDGPKEQARFNGPKAVAIDAAGNVYVTDCGNRRIRRIDLQGTVRTVAGDGAPGAQDGDGRTARFYGMEGLAVAPDGKTLYVADGTNGEDDLPFHRIRKIVLP